MEGLECEGVQGNTIEQSITIVKSRLIKVAIREINEPVIGPRQGHKKIKKDLAERAKPLK